MYRNLLFIFILVAPSMVSAESPLHSSFIGKSDKHIQEEINKAQIEVLNRGPGFSLMGKIEKGRSTPYSINGEDFNIDSSTIITGSLKVGSNGEVSGIIREGNNKVAEVVTIADGNTEVSPPPEALLER